MTDIGNRCLQKLGSQAITSIDQDVKRARSIKLAYPLVRDAEIRRRRWRFAVMRANIPASTLTPAFTWRYSFPLPTGCLRVLQVGLFWPGADISDYRNDTVADYVIEGTSVLTDMGAPLPIRYLGQVTDTTIFDSCFVEALASRLAYELCETITQSDSKRQLAMSDYNIAIKEAVTANALEKVTEFIADNSWITSRLS